MGCSGSIQTSRGQFHIRKDYMIYPGLDPKTDL